jgi:hypothetical protein
VNYARRQQYRRLSRAGAAVTGAAGALALAVAFAGLRAFSLAVMSADQAPAEVVGALFQLVRSDSDAAPLQYDLKGAGQ